MKIRAWVLCGVVLLVGAGGRCEDFDAALARAREAAQRHRFAETIEILQPFGTSDDPEIIYVTAAEIGRAYFHLGRYQASNRAFRQAVAIHPEKPETAIYLEASSYLIGDTGQAFLIFEELLKSGARDLYLAVTLPGSRRFLAEPEVQALLAKYSVPPEVDVRKASVMGVSLGDSHRDVIAATGATAADPTSGALTAVAGPAVLWVFAFDSGQILSDIRLYAVNLLDYTPYRLKFASGIDWTATPAAAIAAWGLPTSTSTDSETGLSLTWNFEGHHVTANFGSSGALRPPEVPEGAAMIRSLRISDGPAPS